MWVSLSVRVVPLVTDRTTNGSYACDSNSRCEMRFIGLQTRRPSSVAAYRQDTAVSDSQLKCGFNSVRYDHGGAPLQPQRLPATGRHITTMGSIALSWTVHGTDDVYR